MVSITDSRKAKPRESPFIWVTWLADLMAGARCQWRYWFLTHNQLKEKANEFDDPTFQIRHSRLVTELEQELRDQGLNPEIEYEVRVPLDKRGAELKGSIDCLTDDETSQIATVWECKTVEKKQKHALQTWLYMYLLTKRARFRDKGIRGMVVYPRERLPHRSIPDDFPSQVDFFEQLLVADRPPRKVPGSDCRFCPISLVDCPERQEHSDHDALDEDDGGER